MSYSPAYKDAQKAARDILRTEQAGRINVRIADAKSALRVTINGVIQAYREFATKWQTKAETLDATAKDIDARRQAIGNLPVEMLAEDETAEYMKQLDKEDEELAAARTKHDEDKAKAEAALKETTANELKEARELVKHHEDNLKKLEAGELKVDKAELEALTQKLLREGQVEAGVQSTAVSE